MSTDNPPGEQSASAGAAGAAHGLDDLLHRLATQGDDAAWEELVIRQWPVVGAVVRRVLGKRDGIEDAVQETFLSIHRSVAGYQGAGQEADRRAQAWIAQLARRTALSWIARRQERKVGIDEDAMSAVISPEPNEAVVDPLQVRA